MRIVLGIDAAWTSKEPSGVALAIETNDGWVLAAAEPSYDHFFALAAERALDVAPDEKTASAFELVEAVKMIAGRGPDLVAIDMPMALTPITGRRGADTAISKAFGARWCSAHSPSSKRPGPISDRLRADFADLGYPLCIDKLITPGLIEVYPHPALVELTDEPRRLPYKLAKIRSYWPKLKPNQRRRSLIGEWDAIAAALEPYLRGSDKVVSGALSNNKAKELKAREDMLDAIVCCISAIRALQGAATSYHDENSAIWVPAADPVIQARSLLPKSPYSARSEIRGELFSDQLNEGKYPNILDPSAVN